MSSVLVFGDQEPQTIQQLEACQAAEDGAPAVLCADAHLGYSMPIGGVVGYESLLSPSAVGYDIACGNMAVRTDVDAAVADIPVIMDNIWRVLSFGVGRTNQEKVEHPVLDEIAECDHPFQKTLATLAAEQLGTIGSGNHYVDLFEDANDGRLWIGVHFGSRGFGHKTASWALEKMGAKDTGMMAPPVVIPDATELGVLYLDGMQRAGAYAYAGREWVVNRVLKVIGARAVDTVHNHHNFAWRELHNGRMLWVHRKGATPAEPGQRGFVGGTMGDPAVILRGIDSEKSRAALRSTVHGAGRVMSRTKAAGKFKGWGKDRRQVSPGVVDFAAWQAKLSEKKIELRGGGADEAPECYKNLTDVLSHHVGTIEILHVLNPIGVAMAGHDTYDPFKD